jgi:hypothetical protein
MVNIEGADPPKHVRSLRQRPARGEKRNGAVRPTGAQLPRLIPYRLAYLGLIRNRLRPANAFKRTADAFSARSIELQRAEPGGWLGVPIVGDRWLGWTSSSWHSGVCRTELVNLAHITGLASRFAAIRAPYLALAAGPMPSHSCKSGQAGFKFAVDNPNPGSARAYARIRGPPGIPIFTCSATHPNRLTSPVTLTG